MYTSTIKGVFDLKYTPSCYKKLFSLTCFCVQNKSYYVRIDDLIFQSVAVQVVKKINRGL